MKTLKIRSTHKTLTEAVSIANIDLSYNEPEAKRSIKDTDRNVSEAYITEDGAVWYVYKCDISILRKFEPFHSMLSDSPFRVAYIVGKTMSFFDTMIPKTPAGRKWFANNKFGALAY